ncbi:MAG: hypothetical protein KF745_14730 [Phycisphaeraceae bacterium]|nr:hypothetical protein [Phycisphaeraceae bacterium]
MVPVPRRLPPIPPPPVHFLIELDLLTTWPLWACIAAIGAIGCTTALIARNRYAKTDRSRAWFRSTAFNALMVASVGAVNGVLLFANERHRPTNHATLVEIGLWSIAGVLLALAIRLGWWALFADRSRGRHRCPNCWYDMTGTPGLTCPECGKAAKAEAALFRTRRRKWWTLAAAVLLIAAFSSAFYPQARGRKWTEFAPTTILIAAMPWLNSKSDAMRELRMRVGKEQDHLWGWQRRLLINRCRAGLTAETLDIPYCELCLDLACELRREAPDILPAAKQLLTASSPALRASAASVVAVFSTSPADVISTLTPLLRDADPSVQLHALTMMSITSPPPDFPPPDELVSLARSDTKNRATAIRALRVFAPTPESIGAVLQAIDTVDDGSYVVSSGLSTLVVLDRTHPSLIPALCRELRSSKLQASAALVTLTRVATDTKMPGIEDRCRIIFCNDVATAAAEALSRFDDGAWQSWLLFIFAADSIPAPWKRRLLMECLSDPTSRQIFLDRAAKGTVPSRGFLQSTAESLPPDHPGRAELLELLQSRPNE